MTRKQNELIKNAVLIKKRNEKLKSCITKIKKPLTEYKMVIDINLYITGNLFLLRMRPSLRELGTNICQVQKLTDIFSKKYIFKVLTVIR